MTKVDIHTQLRDIEMEKQVRLRPIELEHHAPCRARMLRDDGSSFARSKTTAGTPTGA